MIFLTRLDFPILRRFRAKWRLCDFLVVLLVLDTRVCRNSIWSDVGCSLLAEFRSLIMMGTRGFQTLPGLSIGSEKKSKQVIFRWIFWQKYMDRFDNSNNRYFDRTEIAHISQNKNSENSGMSTFNQIHLVKFEVFSDDLEPGSFEPNWQLYCEL